MSDTRAVSILAHYQAELSRLLRAGASPGEIRQTLGSDPTLGSMRSYVLSLQDAPLEVAAALTAKWGRPPPRDGPSGG